MWRETPIDATIFCEAITNNSARPVLTRILHLFCELFYRARASGLIKHNQLAFPVSPVQIGEGLGISIVTVNRTLQRLRATGAADFRDGTLTAKDCFAGPSSAAGKRSPHPENSRIGTARRQAAPRPGPPAELVCEPGRTTELSVARDNCGTVLPRPSVGYTKFFGRIP